jgi:hypothetical protein
MEAMVAKQASARHTPEATTSVKIKNRQNSQPVCSPTAPVLRLLG